MPPVSGNTATSAQIAALQTSVNALSAKVDALAAEVQSLGQQGNAAIAKLVDAVNNLTAKIP